MSARLRLQHVIIQPVFVVDDGEELTAGPEARPSTLTLSQLAAWLEAAPNEIARLQAEMDTQADPS